LYWQELVAAAVEASVQELAPVQVPIPASVYSVEPAELQEHPARALDSMSLLKQNEEECRQQRRECVDDPDCFGFPTH
jgi:hypothetical protein